MCSECVSVPKREIDMYEALAYVHRKTDDKEKNKIEIETKKTNGYLKKCVCYVTIYGFRS